MMTPLIILTILLTMSGNTHATNASCTYLENTRLNLIANCSSRELTSIPEVRSDVVVLDLSNNKLTVAYNSIFLKFSQLRELNLSRNTLKRLNEGAFLGLKNLQKLDLSFNNLAYNISHFSKSVFKPLKSLTYLDVSYNNPFFFVDNFLWWSKYVISDLTKLQHIVIDMHTTSVDYVFREGFRSLTELTTFEAGLCYMHANKNMFMNVPNLRKIDLCKCDIYSYEVGTLQGLHLDYLNYTNAYFSRYDEFWNAVKDFKNAYFQTLLLPTEMQSNVFVGFWEIELLSALNETGVQNLYLVQSNIFNFDPCYTNSELPFTLQHMDMSYNILNYICLIAPNLLSVNLEQNNLGDFLSMNTYHGSNTTNLTDINLSFNNIGNLYYSIFRRHRCLRYLNLSHNFLTDINFDMSDLTSLKVLDISYNRIKKFSHNSIEKLNVIIDSSGAEINLAGNTLECSCESIQFINWILNKREYFTEKHKTKCKFSNGTEIFLTDFDATMMQLKKDCASYVGLILFTSIGVVSMIVLIIIVICYRYRYKLRYIYYMTKLKYIQDNFAQNDDKKYIYDAFISYAENDEAFIDDHCIPFIEKQGELKLCTHKRDFQPGREIFGNIANAIRKSKYVICIITKSFLDSDFCMVEFNMAKMESIYNRYGQNMLLLVFLEKINTKELPMLMQELVHNFSYLEYPNIEERQPEFWKNLKKAMK